MIEVFDQHYWNRVDGLLVLVFDVDQECCSQWLKVAASALAERQRTLRKRCT
jgi:hypothetical protein